ncbi:hypothetical protein TWF481_006313 [Arthrobotrys musiformis]|uniref:Peptide-methionine (R)-S-oxide reductase n=1 Tax=Arthrobotrys musiformis TaxID=47236 RepID=A0AAV9WHY2_9PEZI
MVRISNIANTHSHHGFAIGSRTSASISIASRRAISLRSINLSFIAIQRLSLTIQTRSLSSNILPLTKSKLNSKSRPPQQYLPRLPSSVPLYSNIQPHRHPTTTFQPAKIRSPLNPITLSSLPFIGHFFSTSAKTGIDSRDMATETETFAVEKTDQEWRAVLSREQFRILRQKGTEAPGSGEYDKSFDSGTYNCAACDFPLYKSTTKFKSGCGWPAFYEGIPGAIKRNEDNSFGMTRTEIVCSNCGGHLGHVFKGEGYSTPTDERHCVNSVSLKLEKQ